MAYALSFLDRQFIDLLVQPPKLDLKLSNMAAPYLLIGELIGLGLGPVSVGALLDHVVRDPSHVGAALAIVGAVSTAPGLVLLWLALKPFAGRAALLARAEPAAAVERAVSAPYVLAQDC